MNIIKKLTSKYDPITFAYNIKCIPFQITWQTIRSDKASIPQMKLCSNEKYFKFWWYISVLGIVVRATIFIAIIVNDFKAEQIALDKKTHLYAFLCTWAIGLCHHIHLLCNYRRIPVLFNAMSKFVFDTSKPNKKITAVETKNRYSFLTDLRCEKMIKITESTISIIQMIAAILDLYGVYQVVQLNMSAFGYFGITTAENTGSFSWIVKCTQTIMSSIVIGTMHMMNIVLVYLYVGCVIVYMTLVCESLRNIQ